MKKATPKHCKDCQFFWPHGVKQGGHNMWCCKYGKPTYKAIGECLLKDGKRYWTNDFGPHEDKTGKFIYD